MGVSGPPETGEVPNCYRHRMLSTKPLVEKRNSKTISYRVFDITSLR